MRWWLTTTLLVLPTAWFVVDAVHQSRKRVAGPVKVPTIPKATFVEIQVPNVSAGTGETYLAEIDLPFFVSQSMVEKALKERGMRLLRYSESRPPNWPGPTESEANAFVVVTTGRPVSETLPSQVLGVWQAVPS